MIVKKKFVLLSIQFIFKSSFLSLVLGITIGFMFAHINNLVFVRISTFSINNFSIHAKNDELFIKYGTEAFTTDDNLLLIGIITAKNNLNDRVVAINKTWGKDFNDRIIYFTSEGSSLDNNHGLHLIQLQGVDDTYPPQKKSFLLLKYMHDHYINKFQYFMRADDDVYVKIDELVKFLHSINGQNKAIFIGQAGLGNKQEIGRLFLQSSENFCMGGPGIILNRKALIRLAPHIKTCLKNLYTTHEDVEVGRCMSKYANVSCTWSYEMQKIFYQNYHEPNGSFTSGFNKRTIHKAITLHPFKNTSYVYRAHHYFLTRLALELRNKMSKLYQDIQKINMLLEHDNKDEENNIYSKKVIDHLSLKHFQTFILNQKSEVSSWEYLTSNHVYSALHSNPQRRIEQYLNDSINDVIDQVMDKMNDAMHQHFRNIDIKQLVHAYMKQDPLYGLQYIFHLLLSRIEPKGKLFRKLIYVNKPFLNPVIKIYGDGKNDGENSAIDNIKLNRKINFILPLSGRHQTFMHFIRNFEQVLLKTNENVSLLILLYDNGDESAISNITSHVQTLSEKYPAISLKVQLYKGQFNRGYALSTASTNFNDDDLLFFIDVDVAFSRDVLMRIRLNTIAGQQIYCPIMFSQYDPAYWCMSDENNGMCYNKSNFYNFHPNVGYWREFGFGLVSTFKKDFVDVGLFNLTIKGWGKEDVDLAERFIQHNINIFRSVDIGLVHIYHPIICDKNLDPPQYKMCIGSKLRTFASTENMAKFILNKPKIFNVSAT